jgi:nucleotide-binding universal stress UspA family protein
VEGDPDSPLALHCFDGSDGARAALERAATLLGSDRAVVLCVFDSQPTLEATEIAYTGIPPLVDMQEVDDATRRRALDVARYGCELLGRHGVRAEPVAAAADGSAWRTIVAEADARDAAVIVLGSRGLSGARSVLLGSVSHAVANHTRRPVLIIPPAG